MTSDLSVEVLYGQPACAAIANCQFVTDWRALCIECPHATTFQYPEFVRSWYRSYSTKWQPLIITQRDRDQKLIGLWLLAYDPALRTLVHAGAHQAEYHTWLASPGNDLTFLYAAWSELRRSFAFSELRFKYLPAPDLVSILRALPILKRSLLTQLKNRPLIDLTLKDISDFLFKKINRNRLNRLKKAGKLDFYRVTETSQYRKIFDELKSYYDFRQESVNSSAPFLEDPIKDHFYQQLFMEASNENCLVVTCLDNQPIAASWSVLSGDIAHLGMVMHSPFHAQYSPGTFHLISLCEHLVEIGVKVFDLTPGGDAWKERFATSHDAVAEVTLYRSAWSRTRAIAVKSTSRNAKRLLGRIGVTPAQVRAGLAAVRAVRPTHIARGVKKYFGVTRELRIYRYDRRCVHKISRDDRVHCNKLDEVMAFSPGERWQSRNGFLSGALKRIESGEAIYTVSVDCRLAHHGWMIRRQQQSFMSEVQQSFTFPPCSAVLYDYYTQPDLRGKGLYRITIMHMLCDAFENDQTKYVYITVLANNAPSRHVIEKLGFEYQGSLYFRSKFGVHEKWSSVKSHTANASGA